MNAHIKRFLTIGVLLVATAVLMAAAPPENVDAQAVVDQMMAKPDPLAAYAELTPAEQAAVDEFHTPATFAMETAGGDEGGVAGDGLCNTHNRSYSAFNSVGNTLWRYTTSTYFCYNGTVFITDPNFGTSAYTFYLWQFVGNTNTSESGGIGTWVHTDYAEGHFKLCLPKKRGVEPGCILHNYPWIRKNQWADGSWTSSAGM